MAGHVFPAGFKHVVEAWDYEYKTMGLQMIDMTRGNDWAYIQKVNKEVADHLFPGRTDQSMYLKIYGEVAELVESGADKPEEVADLIIMLLDYAERHNINAAHAVLLKLHTNLRRTWTIDPVTGVAQHVPETEGESS